VVTVTSLTGRAFSETELELVQGLADQTALAFHNARLLEQNERRRAAAEALADVVRLISASLDSELVAQRIVDGVLTLLHARAALLWRLDRESTSLRLIASTGMVSPELVTGRLLPRGVGAAGRAVVERRAVVSLDLLDDPAISVPPDVRAAIGFRPTVLAIPFVVGLDVTGALVIADEVGRAWGPDDMRIAEAFAEHATVALEKARLYDESERRRREGDVLADLLRDINTSLVLDTVLQRLADGAKELCRSDVAAIALQEKGTETYRVRYVAGADRALYEGCPLTAAPGETPRDGGTASVMAVPIRREGRVDGLLYVSARAPRAFTGHDETVLGRLADHAAVAIANAQADSDLRLFKLIALRSDKLAFLGRLVAGLAHELRGPLQNAVSFVAELRERASAPELQQLPAFGDFPDFLKQAHAELRRAAGTVHHLLGYARERRLAFRSTDLAQIVRHATTLVSTQAQSAGKRICVRSAPRPLLVEADAVLMEQVILNVLTNALDALDGPGEIEVAAGRASSEGDDGRAVIMIRDTGCGIAPEDLPKVFDLFYTTKEPGRGMGIGLSLCQSIVEQHGGSISVSSPGRGRGTTVRIELPGRP
jgi:signal transduction histidine kinase